MECTEKKRLQLGSIYNLAIAELVVQHSLSVYRNNFGKHSQSIDNMVKRAVIKATRLNSASFVYSITCTCSWYMYVYVHVYQDNVLILYFLHRIWRYFMEFGEKDAVSLLSDATTDLYYNSWNIVFYCF